ncbi:MAG: electron transfer flavoprotein subunit beta/FixA family protein [Cyanobacteriota bacterium]
MNIIVCIKITHYTDFNIILDRDFIHIDKSNFKYVISSYDELAIKEGLKIRDRFGGNLIILTVAPDTANTFLKSILAMFNIDTAFRVWDSNLENADSFAIAKVLASAIKTLGYDIILSGQKSIDISSGIVGGIVSDMLDIPQISFVTKLELIDEKTYNAYRKMEDTEEIIEFNPPVFIIIQKGLNKPKVPKLSDIIRGKKKEVIILTLSDISLSEIDIVNKVQIISITLPPPKKPRKILTSGVDSVPELLRLLKEEANVI